MNQILGPDDLQRLMGSNIDPAHIQRIMVGAPPAFQPIVHYAAYWGVSDDGDRLRLLQRAPDEAVQNLKQVVTLYEDELDQWLAGPEADGPDFSDAYIAFSAMRMASDAI